MATVNDVKPEMVTITKTEFERLVLSDRKLGTLRQVMATSARYANLYGETPAGDLCRAFATAHVIFPALERAITERKTHLPRDRRVWDLALVAYLKQTGKD